MKIAKQLLSLFLCAAMILSFCPLLLLPSHAAEIVKSGTCGDNLTWTLDSDGLLTIDGSGKMYNFTYNNTPWERSIKSVHIRNGVTNIGNYAFDECTSLTSITIPESVTSIGMVAFCHCLGLISITIPESVTSIGEYAFQNCKGLSSVWFPSSITEIKRYSFSLCTGLTSVTIPASITSIDEHVFWGCTGLTSVTIPESVTSIGDGAFQACSGLTSVTIPASVTSIGDGAFNYCEGLTTVTIPESVTSIGDHAFFSCTGLASVTIPASVTSIGENAFAYCKGLTSVKLPNSVTSIGDGAFQACSGLTSVTISASVTSIGEYAFSFCTSLGSITVAEENPVYHSSGNCVIESAKKALIAGCKTSEIPSDGSVTSIDNNAFYGCTGLTSITIPESVTSIGRWTFAECRGLTSVKLPYKITSIGDGAFCGCTGLTSITIPESVTSIGENAFSFCTSLGSITVAEENPVYHSSGNCVIESAKKALIAGCKTSEIPSDGSVTSIENYAFYFCTGLTSISIPESVTSIGDGAFSDCEGLISVAIPVSVTSIGDGAFQYCKGLTSIKLPDSITSIGDNVFYYCIGLKSITIPASVTSIGSGAFNYCSASLKDVYYAGTESQWRNINIGDGNDALKNAIKHYDTVTFTYDFNGGCEDGIETKLSAPISIPIEKNTSFTLLATWKSYSKKTGYVFGGWGRTRDAQTGYAGGYNYKMGEQDVTLYAIWLKDTDGDGFADVWEKYGMSTDDDDYPDISLKEMGADPEIPDIFVQVDWMTKLPTKIGNVTFGREKSFKPSEEDMRLVYEAFEKRGIHIHLDVGPDSVDYANPDENGNPQKWGAKSNAKAVPYEKIRSIKDRDFSDWINKANQNFPIERRKVFHHCTFVDNIIFTENNETSDISGVSAGIPSQYFMVASWVKKDGQLALAGTFMHELGHNLGLKHGGDENVNYKPNYISVMNYSFQSSGLQRTGGGAYIDYSAYRLDDIDENHLNEEDGVDKNGITEGTGLITYWYYNGKRKKLNKEISRNWIDYNCNKKWEADVKVNVNMDKDRNGNDVYTKLRGFNDWNFLVQKKRIEGENGIKYEIPFYVGPTMLEAIYTSNANNSAGAEIFLSEEQQETDISELSQEEMIKRDILALPGTARIDPQSVSCVANVKKQNLILDLTNFASPDSAFSVKINGEELIQPFDEVIIAKGSTEKLEKTLVSIPMNDDLSPGTYTLFCQLFYEGEEVFSETYTISAVSLTKQESVNIRDAIQNEEELSQLLDFANELEKIEDQLPDAIPFTIGDVDGSGEIEPADARLALRISLGLMTDGETVMTDEMVARADVDGKDGVQPADARLILRKSLGLVDPEWVG